MLYISFLFGARNYARIFIALTTPVWHILANIYCAWISSYRFKNPNAKYIEIKNKIIRKIFVRPISVGGVEFASKGDAKTNIIGLVLNILNTLLFVLFEVLIFYRPYLVRHIILLLLLERILAIMSIWVLNFTPSMRSYPRKVQEHLHWQRRLYCLCLWYCLNVN